MRRMRIKCKQKVPGSMASLASEQAKNVLLNTEAAFKQMFYYFYFLPQIKKSADLRAGPNQPGAQQMSLHILVW